MNVQNEVKIPVSYVFMLMRNITETT